MFFTGENFPYTNFHDLNLDWIIKTMKDTGITVEEVKQYIDSIDETIQNKIDEEVPEAVDEAIQSGAIEEALLTTRTRRFIFIGDSYAEGYTPDGNVTGFPAIIKNQLGITDNENFYSIYRGGSGFGHIAGSDNAFDTLLESISSTVTDKDSITDIVFAGGYNDSSLAKADITAGIIRCRNYIKTNYTNPSLRIWLFAIGYNAKSPEIRNRLYERYNDTYAKSYFIYRKLTQSICKYDWFASDGIHPLANAQEAIAREIIRAMFGCSDIATPIYNEYSAITNGNVVSQMTPQYIRTFLWLTDYTYTFDTPVSISPSAEFKMFEFTSNLPLNNEPDNSMIQTSPTNVIFHRESSPTYVSSPVVFYIKHIANNTWGLFMREYALNSEGSGYETLTGITEMIFEDKTPQFIIPYTF